MTSDKGAVAQRGLPLTSSNAAFTLTPVQRHYIVRALVNIQMQREWSALSRVGALTAYGPPYSPVPVLPASSHSRSEAGRSAQSSLPQYGDTSLSSPSPAPSSPSLSTFPASNSASLADGGAPDETPAALILRHLHRHYLLTLPVLLPTLQPPLSRFWTHRIQPIFDDFSWRALSSTRERAEVTKRCLVSLALTRYIGSFVCRGVRVAVRGERGAERASNGRWDEPARPDEDMMARIDALFDGKDGQTWRKVGDKVGAVRKAWLDFKKELIDSPTALDDIVEALSISRLKNLPKKYLEAEEWARLYVAYLLHAILVSGPHAKEVFRLLKGFHGMVPYWTIKQLLRIANPAMMISALLNLLLARPFGANSLIQTIFSYVVGQEIKRFRERVRELRGEIGDEELCDEVEAWVNGEEKVKEADKQRSRTTRTDLLLVILSRPPSPESLPALHDLLRHCSRIRDASQVISFASSALVPKVIKDMVNNVLYEPISLVAKVSDLSARLADLQAFLNDVIRTVEGGGTSVADMIRLAERHEQSLYFFVHELRTRGGPNLVDPVMDWCRLPLSHMHASLADPTSAKPAASPRITVDLSVLLASPELSASERMWIVSEADSLAEWTLWKKIWWEVDVRKNYLELVGKEALAAKVDVEACWRRLWAEEEERRGVETTGVGEGGVEDGEKVLGGGGRSEEGDAMAWAWFARPDVLAVLDGEEDSGAERCRSRGAEEKAEKEKRGDDGSSSTLMTDGAPGPGPPRLRTIARALVPLFVEHIREPLKKGERRVLGRLGAAE